MNGGKPSPAISEQSRVAVESTADALYGGSLRDFANDRKRLATELRQAGNRAAATAVAKLPRPTLSAWLVNRLWRQARPEFDALFGAAARVRGGELGAVPEQRAALARLRGLAAEVLRADGHAAADGTLTRTSTTLQALAAAGSFEPDPPGRLLADRDPPGFESMAGLSLAGSTVAPLDRTPEPLEVNTGARVATERAARELPAATYAAAQHVAAEKAQRERTAAERAAAQDAAEEAAAERAAAQEDAAEEAAAERTAAARHAAAEREASERLAAERAAAQRAAAERARAVERMTTELTNLERLAEQARRNADARSKTTEDLRVALQRAEAALGDARSRADAAARLAAEARARLDALIGNPGPSS